MMMVLLLLIGLSTKMIQFIAYGGGWADDFDGG
jgi:hypothetical protein